MKKKLPLNIVKAFRFEESEHIDLVRPEQGEGFLLKFLDKDPDSNFFFSVKKFNPDKNTFLVSFSPKDGNSNGIQDLWQDVEGVKKRFKAWIDILAEFEDLDTILEDPALSQFEKDYFEDFELVEEDAKVTQYGVKQIILLDSHLDQLKKELIKKTQEEGIDSKEIVEEIEDFRGRLTNLTKHQTVKRLSRIWAKISKEGVPFIKMIIYESSKMLVGEFIKGRFLN